MKSKIFRVLISCISFVFSFIYSFLCGSGYFGLDKEAEASLLQGFYKSYKSSSYCYNISSSNHNEGLNVFTNFFLHYYTNNFSNNSTTMLTINENNQLAKFPLFFNDAELGEEVTPVSGVNYTNQKDLLRFETTCINLFTYRERAIELSFDRMHYNGFIYIPDFIADFIINSDTNDNLNNYNDLLADDPNISIEIRYDENTRFRYKISNIFHVYGFNDDYSLLPEYKYNDDNAGLKVQSVIGAFCFVSNIRDYLSGDFMPSISSVFGPKKYLAQEFFYDLSRFVNQKQIPYECSIFLNYANQNNFYQRSNLFFESLFSSNDSFLRYLFLTISILSFLTFVFLNWSIDKQEIYQKEKLANNFIICLFSFTISVLYGVYIRNFAISNVFLIYFFGTLTNVLITGFFMASLYNLIIYYLRRNK